jgi:cold shock CspA family protein
MTTSMTKRFGIVRVVNSHHGYAIIEREQTGDGVLCPFDNVEGDRCSIVRGARVSFDLSMTQDGRHLAKCVKRI